ncbi:MULTISPECIES: HTH-type transcriptional regulator HdfR [Providencia]|uniref:HTH-type transcriptional regulator HdfR n=2 Tax=Providencia alcalifaciens TaxID=126385 RepID=A0AAW9V722_9GAMM|nr:MULTISPECIES: HTH-type transcriptional regulator HdfR [Providencia]ATG15802.1 HTH-type transcriptional regulator HdfR [Providencia alcalifaciens]EEB46740.1 transcriptional regulator, LysR family [Providencia alcalifaciens DSM 30120]MBF0691288.1 HTH-type transcriptional regulator HdfR [Providencia alcalifaciens]MTB33098.1 HTH-type transcriptional regulator HdfR [Providencia alcalifaciens]MTC14785.1 HTH-type transcriptional regulator HdfR [Providencia alcalifaciens]
MRVDSELLRTFLEVSRTRHFGRAAESLYLTQSAVSFRIRQLETQLGTSLFTRHRNNIRLTAAGERLVPYAESLMNTWLQAKKEISHASQHTELSIGATASLWESYLTNWLEVLYNQHDELRLEARVSTRQSLVKQLHSRELDLLIAIEPPKMDELESTIIGSIQLQLMASQKNIALTQYNFIKLEWGADFHPKNEPALLQDDTPVMITTSAEITRQLLPVSLSAAFLPTHWLQHYPTLKTLSDNVITKPLYAIWLKKNDQQILINQLIKTPIPNTQ